jgi:mannose-1-phosphate guanylyltransferase/mannose-1-phosphate guanylyltransferase/mannose-6-phosphate isomerase
MLIMPSDHFIQDESAFLTAVELAVPAAEQGFLVTFGVKPSRPDPGFGYIQGGAALAGSVRRVACFKEKPDVATAAELIRQGSHYWNAGIFLCYPEAYLAALEEFAPAVWEAAKAAAAGRISSGCRIYPERASFEGCLSISIDHAVMEKTDRAAVVPVDMGWSDVGSWDALFELQEKDAAGNALHGPVAVIDSSGCFIHSGGTAVVAAGVSNLLIVATKDYVLVLPKGHTHRVKEAVAALASRVSG